MRTFATSHLRNMLFIKNIYNFRPPKTTTYCGFQPTEIACKPKGGHAVYGMGGQFTFTPPLRQSLRRSLLFLTLALVHIRVSCISHYVVIADIFIELVGVANRGERILECIATIDRLLSHGLVN